VAVSTVADFAPYGDSGAGVNFLSAGADYTLPALHQLHFIEGWQLGELVALPVRVGIRLEAFKHCKASVAVAVTAAPAELNVNYMATRAAVAVTTTALLRLNLGLKVGLNGQPVNLPTIDAPPKHGSLQARHQVGARIDPEVASRSQVAKLRDSRLVAPSRNQRPLDPQFCALFDAQAQKDQSKLGSGWNTLNFYHRLACPDYGALPDQPNGAFSPDWIQLIPTDRKSRKHYFDIDRHSVELWFPDCPPVYLIPDLESLNFSGESGYAPETDFEFCPFLADPPERGRATDTNPRCFVIHRGEARQNTHCLPWSPLISRGPSDPWPGVPGLPPGPPGAGPVIIPLLGFYIMENTASLRRASDNLPIPFSALSFSLDASSWAWSVSGTLLGGHPTVEAITDADKQGVELIAEVNGVSWRFMPEQWKQTKAWPKEQVTFSGRGLSAELSHPTLARDFIEDAPRTLPQLAMQELDSSLRDGQGILTNWGQSSLTWEPLLGGTTSIPGGSWSYSKQTPIEAIQTLANGTGCVVVPARDTRELTVRYRYPILPWNYDSATPDFQIDGGLFAWDEQSPGRVQANAVHVHGSEVGGRSVLVYRDGTAGDVLAPDQQNNLIVHSDVGKMLGRRILAQNWTLPIVRSVTMPFDNDTFMLPELCDLIEVNGTFGASRGTVSAVDLSVSVGQNGAITVEQSVDFSDGQESLFSRFQSLIPNKPIRIAEIVSDYGNNAVKVEHTGGGFERVIGAGVIGAKVYVQGGRIIGDAPSLPVSNVFV
jgi:hypothetical protein